MRPPHLPTAAIYDLNDSPPNSLFKKYLLNSQDNRLTGRAYGAPGRGALRPPRPPRAAPLEHLRRSGTRQGQQQQAAKPSKQPPARFKQQTQGYTLAEHKKPPGGRFGGLWVARSDRRNTQPQAYGVKHFGNRV